MQSSDPLRLQPVMPLSIATWRMSKRQHQIHPQKNQPQTPKVLYHKKITRIHHRKNHRLIKLTQRQSHTNPRSTNQSPSISMKPPFFNHCQPIFFNPKWSATWKISGKASKPNKMTKNLNFSSFSKKNFLNYKRSFSKISNQYLIFSITKINEKNNFKNHYFFTNLL